MIVCKRFARRFVSLVLALALLIACLPQITQVFAATVTKRSYTINQDRDTLEYLIDKVEKEENAYIAARLRLLIYGDGDSGKNSANMYFVGSSFPSSGSYQTFLDGETGKNVSLLSAQCFAYAEWAYYKYFGYTQYNSGSKSDTQTVTSEVKFTETNLRNAIAKTRCGAHIRIANSTSGYKHSISFITTDEANTGFYYLEGTSNGSGGYIVKLCFATYAAFASTYSGKKLSYIIQPANYPGADTNDSQLNIYNAKVPVNVKTSSVADVIGTIVMSDCNIKKINVGVYGKSGNAFFDLTIKPNCHAYRFGNFLDKSMTFSSLSAGSYVYKLYAEDESGATITIERDFTVSGNALKYTTVSEYSYPETPFGFTRYYISDTPVNTYYVPNVVAENREQEANIMIAVSGSYTDANGTIWYHTLERMWVMADGLTEHHHTLSETGLCTSDFCDYDSTDNVSTFPEQTAYITKNINGYSRPYTSEAEERESYTAKQPVGVTGSVVNIKGEKWYRVSSGSFIPESNLSTATKIDIVTLPTKTVYSAGDNLNSTGISIRVTLSNGDSFNTSADLTYSYDFTTVGQRTVTVYYSNLSTTFVCKVNAVIGYEMWKVTTSDGGNVNIRKGPGTSHNKNGKYADGTVLKIVEIKPDEDSSSKLIWGKVSSDVWVALDYCTYVEGYLYEVKYDLNGASGTNVSEPCSYKNGITVKDITNDRDGYVFAGWATKKNATKAEYEPDDICRPNASMTLYAVWLRELEGSIAISGNAVYDSTITLIVSSIVTPDAQYNIEWLRNGETIAGANSTTYKIGLDDISHDIAAHIVGKNGFTGEIIASGIKVTKKNGTAVSKPEIDIITTGSITVKAVSGAEYSLDGQVWQKSSTFTNLRENTVYTVYIRMAETEISFAGTSASAEFSTLTTIPSALTSNELSINESSKLISKIESGLTAAQIKNQINERDFVLITDSNNTPLADTDIVGTGCRIVISSGNKQSTVYTAIVTGDVNGDGAIDVSDLVNIKSHILARTTIDSVYFIAGDVNGDGYCDVSDYVAIKSYILGKNDIMPRAV